MRVIFLLVVVLVYEGTNGLLLRGMEYGDIQSMSPSARRDMPWFPRMRRIPRVTHKVIDPKEDCFLVTSEEGQLFFKSPSSESSVCGIYMIAEPDQRIQVIFNYLDVPCENGGLVAWVDGWELNGQVWPADSWDDDRVLETCDQRPKRKLVSRQNAALIQYRVPARGKGFAITIRHFRNARPCNVMLFGAEGVFTLRNHGQAGNCSVIAIAPATVRVLDLNVGFTVKKASLFDVETGTIHRCIKRGSSDFVDIGGANGLDHTKMEVLDSLCGLDSNEELISCCKKSLDRSRLYHALSHIQDSITAYHAFKELGHRPWSVACEDTVVRLVSSGRYHNSVTLAFSPLPLDDIDHADLICGLNDI